MANGIDLVIDGPLARLTLNRPERRNAFDLAMLAAFEDALHRIAQTRDVNVVLMTGAGSTFCAGTDLKELQDLDAAATLHWQRRTGEAVERWARLDAVTVTAFNGPAIGSGAVLGFAADLRIGADTLWFTLPEVGFGIPLTWSGVSILAPLIGADRVKRALLLAERFDAAEIGRLGLAEIVRAGGLDARVDAVLKHLLAAPALAQRMTKRATAALNPGFAASAWEPFNASLAIAQRGHGSFDIR